MSGSPSQLGASNKRSQVNLQGAHDMNQAGFLPLREEDEPLNEQQFH